MYKKTVKKRMAVFLSVLLAAAAVWALTDKRPFVEAAASYRETYDEIRDGIEEYNNSKNPGMDVELGTRETFPVEYTADSYDEEGNACHVRTTGTAMGLWNDDGDSYFKLFAVAPAGATVVVRYEAGGRTIYREKVLGSTWRESDHGNDTFRGEIICENDVDLSVYASGIDHKDVTGFEAWLQKAGDGRIYVMPLKKTGGRFDISTYAPLPDELTEDERPSHTVTIIDKVYDWENDGGYTEKEELIGSYREGEWVKVTPADADYTKEFDRWEIMEGGDFGFLCPNGNPGRYRLFKMPAADVKLRAVYKDKPKYRVRVINGSICGYDGSPGERCGEFGEWDYISIMADEKDGRTFEKWTVAEGSAGIIFPYEWQKEEKQCGFSMPAENVTVKAVYTDTPAQTHRLTVSGGRGSGDYNEGDVIPIMADEAGEGRSFKEWSVDSGGITPEDSASPATTVTMPGNDAGITAVYDGEGTEIKPEPRPTQKPEAPKPAPEPSEPPSEPGETPEPPEDPPEPPEETEMPSPSYEAFRYEVYAAECGSGFAPAGVLYEREEREDRRNFNIMLKIARDSVCHKYGYSKRFKFKWKKYGIRNGRRTFIGSSIPYHIAEKDNPKWTNAEDISLKKTELSVKSGKSVRIKAKIVKESKRKKLLSEKHRAAIRYFSDDEGIAEVDETGRVTGKSSGTCLIRAVALNGLEKKVKITVE